MSEKSSGAKVMRTEISIVAGPRGWNDTRESWLARVPRKVPTVTYRTVRARFSTKTTGPRRTSAARPD